MKIRAISLWEPWATAWAIGLKKGETRAWAPPPAAIGAPFALCSAKTERDPDEYFPLKDWFNCRMIACEESSAAFIAAGRATWESLPRGHVIAIFRLADVRPTSLCGPHTRLEDSWGNFSSGRYVWLPEKMTPLATPIPVVGRQRVFWWEVPADLHAVPAIADILGPF